MKLKSIISGNSLNLLSINELRSIVGGSVTSNCYCEYSYRTSPTTPSNTEVLVNESGLTENECVNKCTNECNKKVYCNAVRNLRINFKESGTTGSGSDSIPDLGSGSY